MSYTAPRHSLALYLNKFEMHFKTDCMNLQNYSIISFAPVHVTPFPVYPSLQVQVKLPKELLQ